MALDLFHWFAEQQQLLMLSFVLLLEPWIKIPASYHPIELVRATARQLKRKVHHPERQDAYQQRIAGAMATLLMLLLWVPVPALIAGLSAFPLLLDGAILLLCLNWRSMAHQLWQLTRTEPMQKELRKTLLTPWVARDCNSLSSIGIHKAALEALYLRSWHDRIAYIFWFLTLGSWAVLSYKIILEISREWHPRLEQQTDFGLFAKRLRSWIDWFPQLIWALWLLLTSFRAPSKSNLRQALQFGSTPRGLVLLAASIQHHCHTGGPAIYHGQKYQRPRLIGHQEPEAPQLRDAMNSLNLRTGLLMGLLWLLQAIPVR